MILYADTVGLTNPDEGIITASVGVTHANHDVKPVDETRKHSGIYDSTLSDGWATEHPSRLSDGQIGSSTELVNGKAFTTSGGEVFYTSDVEVYHTADTTDVGFMFNLTEEKLTDFIGLYVDAISGSATVTYMAQTLSLFYWILPEKLFSHLMVIHLSQGMIPMISLAKSLLLT